jgi:hypothetical protein
LSRARAVYWLACGAIAVGCASPGMPPGGPPDDEVPRIARISPDSNALNVRSDVVLIHFDEVISERPTLGGARPGAAGAPAGGGAGAVGLAAIVSISPSDGRERVNWRRTAIEIEPRRGFRPNTAYRVVIEPGVTDLRGNVLGERVEFVFSTGGALPTSTLSGVVFDWAGAKSAPNARVEVFPPTDSTLRWSASADSLGQFTVRDLTPGRYLVRAWIDANNDRLHDRREAIEADTVDVDSIGRTELYAFVQDTLSPRIETVEFADSLTLRVRFDRVVAADWSAAGAVTLVGADSVPRAIGQLVPSARLDSLRAAARANADTTVADSVAAPDSAALADTVAQPSAPQFGRPAPIQLWALPLDVALPPGLHRLTIRAVRGLNGRARDTDREFTVRAPPPRPPSDSAAPPPRSP